MGDFLKTLGWEGEGDITLSEYIKFSKERNPEEVKFEDIPDGFGKTVDVSGRDMTTLDGVDEALGLVGKRNDKSLSFVEIRDKVKAFDKERDEKWAATGAKEIVFKLIAELSVINNDINDDTNDGGIDDTEEQKKRRSSLISLEYELSCVSLGSTKENNEEKKKIMKKRRESLIKTGKCD